MLMLFDYRRVHTPLYLKLCNFGRLYDIVTYSRILILLFQQIWTLLIAIPDRVNMT